MSGFVGGSGPILITPLAVVPRQITGNGQVIIPDCVVEEIGVDSLQITEHPVEFGASITDHAFNKPRQITLRWMWSDSSNVKHAAFQGFVLQIYNYLLTLKQSLSPFVINAGKSQYFNMLMESLTQTTRKETEFVLEISALCKEIILVPTSTTSATVPASNMKNPSSTAPVTQSGQTSLKTTSANSTSSITSSTQFPTPPIPPLSGETLTT